MFFISALMFFPLFLFMPSIFSLMFPLFVVDFIIRLFHPGNFVMISNQWVSLFSIPVVMLISTDQWLLFFSIPVVVLSSTNNCIVLLIPIVMLICTDQWLSFIHLIHSIIHFFHHLLSVHLSSLIHFFLDFLDLSIYVLVEDISHLELISI